MKVAFDEHVPTAMARVFASLTTERQFRNLSTELKLESAKDYAPQKGDPDYVKKNDVPWLKRFASAGGRVVISGNTRMRRNEHERRALVELGFVTIFFESPWSNWTFYPKCSLLLHWWPAVMAVAQTAKPGTFWAVPSAWQIDGKLRQLPTTNAALVKRTRQLGQAETIRKRRRSARKMPEQGLLDFDGTPK